MRHPEFALNTPELPFPEVSIEEMDIEFRGDTWAHKIILNVALDLGYSRNQLLYRGIDRADIDSGGNFVHDRYEKNGSQAEAVWAFTDPEFTESARRADSLGQRSTDSPLFYAFDTDEHPAVVILDTDKLGRLSDHMPGEDERQYVAAPGGRLEDAIIAVVNITH